MIVLMEKGESIFIEGKELSFVAPGSKNPKADAVAVVESFANHDRVSVFVNGLASNVISSEMAEIMVVKMDADCDRVAAQTGGKFLDANSIGALLVDYHLKNLFNLLNAEIIDAEEFEKYRRFLDPDTGIFNIRVGRTVASTELVDSIMEYWKEQIVRLDAEKLRAVGITNFTFQVDEVGVGFKNFAEYESKYLVWFESSAHIADCITGVETKDDGLAIGLRIVEMWKHYGRNLADVVFNIKKALNYNKEFLELAVNYGGSSKYEETRDKLKITTHKEKMKEDLLELLRANGSFLQIKEVVMKDGLKIIFDDGSSVLVRVSGTERVGRIFVQADPETMEFMQALGYYLLGQASSNKKAMMLKFNYAMQTYFPEMDTMGLIEKLLDRMNISENMSLDRLERILQSA